MKELRGWQGMVGMAALAGVLLPLSVWAHAQLVRSEPTDGAQLGRSPAQVELWFGELLEPGMNTVEVFAAQPAGEKGRTNRVAGAPVLDTKDATHLTVLLQRLPPGEYVVLWRVLSRDGHSAPGRIQFGVKPGP